MNIKNKILSYIHSIFNYLYNLLKIVKIRNKNHIYLYAGDVPNIEEYKRYWGLSLWNNNKNHIKHDVTKVHPFKPNSIDIYQSEDVFEHINYDKLPDILNDIYRILKPKGIFRLSLPDYGNKILIERSIKNELGEIIFDPGGGGKYIDGKIIEGGHLWFPKYNMLIDLLKKTNFKKYTFYHFYDENGIPVVLPIDYKYGYIQRTPDNDDRVREENLPLSIVVDCIKD